jgi:hypothetical protein
VVVVVVRQVVSWGEHAKACELDKSDFKHDDSELCMVCVCVGGGGGMKAHLFGVALWRACCSDVGHSRGRHVKVVRPHDEQVLRLRHEPRGVNACSVRPREELGPDARVGRKEVHRVPVDEINGSESGENIGRVR